MPGTVILAVFKCGNLSEVPLSATVFDGTQAEPLNPLAVVRRTVLFAHAGDGNSGCTCFRCSVWRGFVFSRVCECRGGQHGEQERQGVAGARDQDGLGQRTLAGVWFWSKIDLCGERWHAKCHVRSPPAAELSRRTRKDWGRGGAHGRRVLRPDGVVFSLYRRGVFVARCAFRVVVGTPPFEELA